MAICLNRVKEPVPDRDVFFISYATPDDNEFVRWLGTRLAGCGYKVCADIFDLAGGAPFWISIEDAIRKRAVKVIAVVSHSSCHSDRSGVRNEISVADTVKRALKDPEFIIPIRIDDVAFAGVVLVVFGAGMWAPKLSARLGLHRAVMVGLGIAAIGSIALLLAVVVAKDSFFPFVVAVAVFLLGVGIASPLSSAAALAPFGGKAGVAAALLAFSQMAGGAFGASLTAAVSIDPAMAIGTVLSLASLLALNLYGRADMETTKLASRGS